MSKQVMNSMAYPGFSSPKKQRGCAPMYKALAGTKFTALPKRGTSTTHDYVPNKETRETIEKASRGEDVYGPFATVEELMAFLDA